MESGDVDASIFYRAFFHLHPDFTYLVSDIVMPGTLSGIDLGHAARDLKPDLGVVLMTGHAGDDRAGELERCPFPILRKPFDRETLAATLSGTREGT